LLLAACWACIVAQAQTFPSRPVTLVVPWPAGGASDFAARALGKELEPLLGQTVIVENAPGAGGSLGVAKALRAPADGHTLILSSPLDVVLAPLIYPAAGFTAHDTRAVAVMGRADLMLVTRADLGVQSMAELVAVLKASPDKPLSYCAMSSGSPQQLVGMRISALTGVKLNDVPYSGMPDCIKNLIGGQIDLAFLPIGGPFPALVDQGRIKAIAALGAARHPRLPQLPRAAETPGFEGLSMSFWGGLHVHAQVPEAAVQRLHEAAMAALQSPVFRKAMESTGVTLFEPMSLAQAQSAHLQTVGLYQAMLPAPGPQPSQDLDSELQRCRDLLNAGRFEDGEAAARRLVDASGSHGSHDIAAHAALLLARLMANTSRAGAAIDWARASLKWAERAGARNLQASAWVVLAGASAESDQPVVALDAVARALALVDDAMPGPQRRSVYTGIAITFNALGLPRQALPAAQRALAAEAALGPSVDLLRERWNLLITGVRAHEQLLTVDPEGAAALLDELAPHGELLLNEAEQDGRAVYTAGAAHAVGLLRHQQGRWQEAATLIRTSVMTPTEEQPGELRDRWLALAQALSACGEPAEAAACAEIAAQCAAAMADPPGFQDLEALALLESLRGRHREALALHHRFHRQVMHNLLAAFEVQLADRASAIGLQALRLENQDLRERMTSLSSHAAHLTRLAQTDALTGALSRRALQEAYARRDIQRAWTLLLLDADRFKQVNDGFSHLVGDQVLKTLADILRGHLRGDDCAGRYGGEEFVVLLGGASLEDGRRVAERLREAVERYPWQDLARGLSVTISGGLVAVAQDDTLESALARADALLYAAKSAGRNRVHTAPV
jgi:diguanylate cyclase (GGDEF)-like protein